MWFGHNLKNPIPFWEFFDGNYGILLNAYHILSRPTIYRRFADKGIKETLNFKGKVFIDSGGFLFQLNREMDVSAKEILELYKDIKGDLKVILDQPLNPNVSVTSNRKRWVKTFTNTEIMLKYDPNVVPVLHGYTPRQIKVRAKELKKLIPKSKFVCVGSLVPLFKGSYYGNYMKVNKTSRWQIIEGVVKTVREEFSDSFLHIFGAGSIKAINKLYEFGADSVDSVSWQLRAAYGEIITTTGRSRALKSQSQLRPKRKSILAEKDSLTNCSCPVCAGLGFEDQIWKLSESYINRAIHNSFQIYHQTEKKWI